MNKELQEWAKENIKFVGNSYTNQSGRRGCVPIIIVDHITEGSCSSCVNWFTSAGNYISSAHFLVCKSGKIFQFVEIEKCAWANGLAKKNIYKATSKVVRSMKVSPNWKSVTVEHEGIYNQTYGALTSLQLASTIKLHEYIIAYVKDAYGHTIKDDRDHIIGHCEVSPSRKPNCPGKLYPFTKVIEGLNKKEEKVLTMSDIRKILGMKDVSDWGDPEIIKAQENGLLLGKHKSDEIVQLGTLMTILNRMYEKLKEELKETK